MRVSILVPIFKVEDRIVKCARSIFEQNYEDCEFIFVDDCSPDTSVERLKRIIEDEYAHIKGKCKIVKHSRNRGVAEARNTAMECATGEFLIFVDSDDWCDQNLVSKLVREQHRCNADIVSSDFYHTTVKSQKHISTHWVGGREGSLHVVLAQSFALPNRVWSMLIRTEMIHRNGIRFDGSVNYGEDSLLLVKLLYFAREISHVGQPLYYYRADSEGSYSNNVTRSTIRNYVRSQIMIWEFISQRDAMMRFAMSLFLSRMNLRRWLLIRKNNKNPLAYLYRIWCFIINKLWILRCLAYGF
ncbi:MAG: glycosyltransferase family 2 protein [Rikenellaceae bacterium]